MSHNRVRNISKKFARWWYQLDVRQLALGCVRQNAVLMAGQSLLSVIALLIIIVLVQVSGEW